MQRTTKNLAIFTSVINEMVEKLQKASRHQVLSPKEINAQGIMRPLAREKLGCLSLSYPYFSSQIKEDKYQPGPLAGLEGRRHGRSQEPSSHAGAPRTSKRRYSQLAEAVKSHKSTTGIFYCARNLVMVQIPGEKTERQLTIQFSTCSST